MTGAAGTALAHGLILHAEQVEQQRDAARRWAASALAENFHLREAIEQALGCGLHPIVDRILRDALKVPTQREGQ